MDENHLDRHDMGSALPDLAGINSLANLRESI